VIQNKIHPAFHTPNGLHIRDIDQKTAELFKKAGFRSLFLSQESLDPHIINRSCPKTSPGDLEKAVSHLQRAGYSRKELSVYLMTGLPGQTYSSAKHSIQQVLQMGLRPRLAYFSPVPHTEDWKKLVSEKKLLPNHDPLLHNKLVAPYSWGDISPDEFEALKKMILPC
jgi:radical SAM superfamily enzyme YgiQ (UPF0313 family)